MTSVKLLELRSGMAVVVRAGRPVKAPQQLERLTGRHFISRIKTNGKKRNLASLCKVCNEAFITLQC
jgi:hypothetical protein